MKSSPTLLIESSWKNAISSIKQICKDIINWRNVNKLASLPWEDKDVQSIYDELKQQREDIDFIINYIEDYLKNGGKCEGFDIKLMDGKSKIEDIKKTLSVCQQYGIESKDVLCYMSVKITTFKPFFVKHLIEKGFAKNRTEAKAIYESKLPIVKFDERKGILRLLNENKEKTK